MRCIEQHYGKRVWVDDLFTVSKRTGCWLWAGAPNASGYGRIMVDHKRHLAHRWMVGYTGPLVVMHSCDNPRCVNPEHLSVGTHEENMKDAVQKGKFKGPRPHFQGPNHPLYGCGRVVSDVH